MSKLHVLEVYLNDYPVGLLTQLPDDRIHFHFTQGYLADTAAPILSQSFYTAQGQIRADVPPTQTTAPSFFANLLPEGALREYLAKSASIKSVRDFALLQLLGQDLPGAITLKPLQELLAALSDHDEQILAQDEHDPTILKFSLAGVQLKFSALMRKKGHLTIPAHGMGGQWIVKLPSARYPYLPENEFSMLELARAIGIEVPQTQLVELTAIKNLPPIVTASQDKAFVIQRFDRHGAQRIHMEDFAQVYGIYPQKKYEGVSYNNIAQMLSVTAGEKQAYEFIKRLVFNILIGNSDMHLKNGALLYTNTRIPQLAPAYDYVATHVFLDDSKMALSIAGEKEIRNINNAVLKRFAEKAKLPSNLVLQIAQETIEKTLDAWKPLKSDLPLPKSMRVAIEKQLLVTAGQF